MNHADALRQQVAGAPLDSALVSELLRDPNTWLVVLFGLAPIAINTFAVDPDLQMLLLSAYFTLAWVAYFYIVVGKRAVNLWAGLASALFMLCIGVPIGRFLHFNVLMPFYDMTTAPSPFVQWAGNVLSHGLNEEAMKALSVLLLAFPLRQVKKPIDGVFYGALSGLGFAAWEGHKLIVEAQTPAVMMMTVAVRSVSNCLLHASYTGISGYFIALAALSGKRRAALCTFGIGIAILLHGSFDFRADTRDAFPLSLLLGTMTYLLFAACVARGGRIADQREQLRVAHADAVFDGRS